MACAPTRLRSSLPVAGPSIAGAGSSPAAKGLDEAYVPFFGAFGAAWDDAMVARWSANLLRMLGQEMDAAFVTSGGGSGCSPVARGRWSSPPGVEDRVGVLVQMNGLGSWLCSST
jgi:hypothetical protein